jgi:hypothetical protein
MGRAADVRGPRLKPEERKNAFHKRLDPGESRSQFRQKNMSLIRA